MQATMPERVDYLVVGAGIQGLAAAGAIGRMLEETGRGSGDGVLVIDKAQPGAGASYAASGSVHRFDLAPILYPVVDRTLDLLLSDPVTFGFQQVGAIRQSAPLTDNPRQGRHPAIRILSPEAARDLTEQTWPDLIQPAGGRLSHDPAGGYTGSRQLIAGLTEMARRQGVRIHSGVEVTRYETGGVTGCTVVTTRGDIIAGQVIVAVGSSAPQQWAMLDLPPIADGAPATGSSPSGWLLQPCLEGDAELTRPWRTPDNRNPPLLIVDTNTPDGHTVSVSIRNGGERLDGHGVHIRLMAWEPIEQSGSTSWFHATTPTTLSNCLGRFQIEPPTLIDRPCTGGVALSPDRFPVVDHVAPSVYWIGDAGLGVRGAGLGLMAADYLVTGARDPALAPFSLGRFHDGGQHDIPTGMPLPGL